MIDEYFSFINSFNSNFLESQKEKSKEYSYIGEDINLCMRYLYDVFISFPKKNSLFLNYYCIQSNLLNDYSLYLLHLDKDFLHDIVNDSLFFTYNFVLRKYGEKFTVTPTKFYLKSFSKILLFVLKNKLKSLNTQKNKEKTFILLDSFLYTEIDDDLIFSKDDIFNLW